MQRQGETVRGGERQGETIRGQGETVRGGERQAAAGSPTAPLGLQPDESVVAEHGTQEERA